MPIKSLSVVITGNAAGLTTALKAASAQLTAFDRQVTAASAVAGRLSTASSGTSAAVVRLGPAAASAATSVTRLGAASSTAATALGRLGTTSGTAATNLTRLGAAANTSAGALGRMNGVTTAAAASQARLGTASAAAAAGTSRLGAAGAAGAEAAGRLGTGAAGATGAVGRLGGSSSSTSGAVSRLGQAAGAAGGTAGQLGRGAAQGSLAVSALGASAKTAAAGGILVLGVALAASVAGAVRFEAQMRNVASIDKQVEQNFDATSQAVLNMSKHLPQSAKTLAEGLYNVAGSGFYGADAMHILETSATAASAGLTDTNTASKAIVASLNAYGMSAGEAGRISDALFSTVNYGVISFEALTGAVANSVGNAAKAGISIEELGSALATMTLSGMTASNAGVSLNNMISKLVKPSAALGKATVQLGINLKEDLANPAIGLHGVMEKLRIASQGNVTTLLQWFPEIRAARGAMALMAGDGANYARVIGEMGNAQLTAGETARVFAIQAQSVKSQLAILGNQIAVTGIELGMRFLPYIEDAVGGLTQLGVAVKAGARELGSAFGPAVTQIRETLGNLGDAAGDVWAAFEPLVGLAAKLGLGALAAGLTAVGAAANATTGFLSDHETALYAVVAAYAAWKIPAIITGVMALGTSLRWITAGLGFLAVQQYTTALAALQARLQVFGTSWASMGMAAGVYGLAIGGAAMALNTMANASDKAREKVKALVGEFDSNNVQQMEQALAKVRDRLTEMGAVGDLPQLAVIAKSLRDGQAAATDASAEYKELVATAQQLADGLEAARQKQETLTQNTQTLAQMLGLSTESVRSLAEAHRLDLSGALFDSASASGGLYLQMKLARQELVDSTPAVLNNAQAFNVLSFDAKAADTALESLTETFDLLTGKLISGQTSAANLQIEFLKLAAGESLATDASGQHTASLDSNSIAGLQNQNMIRGLIEQVRDNAKAQYESQVATEGVEAATGVYNGTLTNGLTALRNSALQAGMTATEFDALTASVNLVPDEMTTTVEAPGLTDRTREANELTAALNSVPRQVTVTVTTRQVTQWVAAATSPTGPSDRYLSSTIPTGLNASGNRASGGPISGPGSGTSDDVPIMASNGEWVIRESSSAKYGPAAMAAVNDGRARIIVPEGYAAGGPIRPAPTRAATAGTGAAPGSGTTGAIQQIASGAASLADVYQATTQGVIGTARALREVVPRMWRADQQSSSLAASTAGADGQMGRWRDTLVDTTGRVDLHRDGLRLLGLQMGAAAVQQYPALTQAVDLQTVSRQAETAAQTLHQQGLVLLGTTMDTASGVQLPALTGSTDLQTASTDLLTAAVDLGTQAYTLATEAAGVDTDARDVWTTATDLGTAATDLLTAAVDLATAATGEQTTATTTQTTATGQQTTATNTANTATGTFTGTVNTNSTALNQNAASATAAAAAVREYAAALNAVPKQVTSTVTTNYVTTGTKQAAGFAGGGQIYGPGTGTSDSVPILASRDEWIIRAAAARQYGPAAMSAVNAGTARIVAGSAQGFASGGLVGGYAQGGMVRGAWTPVGGNTTVINNFSSNVTVTGAGSPTETARLVERKVDAKFAQLATRIGARPGRGRG